MVWKLGKIWGPADSLVLGSRENLDKALRPRDKQTMAYYLLIISDNCDLLNSLVHNVLLAKALDSSENLEKFLSPIGNL